MKKRNLVPPLEVIESDLFALVEPVHPVDVSGWSEVEEATGKTAASEMPAFLKDAIQRRVAAQDTASSQAFAPGQIRRVAIHLTADGDIRRHLVRPVALLLDHPGESANLWSGWLVAPEVDYATVWDVLLEAETDEPFDPLAGMVQVWNPLACLLEPEAALLATLSQERLDAVRAVALAFPRLEVVEQANPGSVAPRTVSGYPVLTGSPLGNTTDPRRIYQNLYFQLARELICLPLQRQASPAEGGADNVVPLRKGFVTRNRPVWMAIAASLMVVQGGLIAYLLQSESNPLDESTSQYRSIAGAKAKRPQIEVVFRADAPEVDIRRLLINVGGEIVGGPGRNGIYQIYVRFGDLNEVTLQLRQSAIVESVSPFSGKTGN